MFMNIRAMMRMGLVIHHACQFASVNLHLDDGGLPFSPGTVSCRTVYCGNVSDDSVVSV